MAPRGTRKENLEPGRLQRIVRNGCDDLGLTFNPKSATMGVDSLDFGTIEYAGPAGRGVLALELSLREDWILDREQLVIEAYGIPRFSVQAMALAEMVAEKWRCLIQRSPRRPGDPYDLWLLWSVVRTGARGAELDPRVIRELVPLVTSVSAAVRTKDVIDSPWTRTDPAGRELAAMRSRATHRGSQRSWSWSTRPSANGLPG